MSATLPDGTRASAQTGQRVGAYELRELLGAGGMGEVYRAHDTKLGRDVAIKLLPRIFTSDPERLARFEREARMLASLNHPNIGGIYGLEDAGESQALVLELVEGETLAERLAARRLNSSEALQIARQVIDAFDAAHDKGIVHRDLKPANIKITPEGVVKVLDFGLAKPVSVAPAGTALATTVIGPTREGAVVGTAPYMSPEQARGHAVDKRTDIWAFGCVLYELLTGRTAFGRETVSDTIAAILERQPDLDALPASTPSGVRRVLAHCLEKDPKRRFRDIGDVRLALDEAVIVLPLHAPGAARSAATWRTAFFVLLLGIAVLAGAFTYLRLRPPTGSGVAPPLPVLTRATADDGLTIDPAISRDGALLAYASDRGGRENLDIWIQQASGGAPIQLTHDEVDEREPVFSPDGSQIAFRSERDGGGIYIVPAFGGQQPRLLVREGRRPRFSPDGLSVAYWTGTNIGFSSSPNSYRTYVIPAVGGTPRAITGLTGMRYPVWSPDGRALIVLGSRDERPILPTYTWWIAPLDGGSPTETDAYEQFRRSGISVGSGNVGPDAWQDGRILFSDFSYLWSASVDQSNGRVSGIERLTFGTNFDGQASISSGGTMAFASVTTSSHLWTLPVDTRRGVVMGDAQRLTNGAVTYTRVSATSDGQRIAYLRQAPRIAVLVKDMRAGTVTDLGVEPTPFGPAISPDGRWVAFGSADDVLVTSSTGGSPKAVCQRCAIGDWTGDSRGITVVMRETQPTSHLALVDIASGSIRNLTEPNAGVLNRPFLGPGNRLLAFREDTVASDAIFVAPVRPNGPSPKSGWVTIVPPELDARPCGWSPDGSMLYLVSSRDGTRCLYAQRVDPVTGTLQGECVLVKHFAGARNTWAGQFGVLSTGPGNAMRGGSFLYDLGEASSNIWTMAVPAAK